MKPDTFKHQKEADADIFEPGWTIASPECALSFLFSIFALLMGYLALVPEADPATLLSAAVTWLILSTGALAASLVNMIRGNAKGNTNLLATILMGLFPGINTLFRLFSQTHG